MVSLTLKVILQVAKNDSKCSDEAPLNQLLTVLPPVLNLLRNKFQCCNLRQYVAQSRPEFYFLQQFYQLETLKFVAWQVEHEWYIIRATTLFNWQCNNVARKVERKCYPYYTKHICYILHSSFRTTTQIYFTATKNPPLSKMVL